MKKENWYSGQTFIFGIGLIIFLVAAVFGWIKLQYGFNFLDEGFHMTASWRLAAGDHFLNDTNGVLRLYTLINCQIFKIFPDITLLGFRKLQYCFTMFAILLFSISLYKFDKQFWYFGFIFSIFAFTGLDPVGATSNLSYYTYPHFFLTLHIAFFLLGLSLNNHYSKNLLFVVSGLCLWLIGLTLLHLSLIAIYPVILFLLVKKLQVKNVSYSFKNMCCVLTPFVFFWAGFIAIYNKVYINAVFGAIKSFLSIDTYSKGLTSISLEPLQHIAITVLFVFLIVSVLNIEKVKLKFSIIFLSILSIFTFYVIDTSFFGVITPYWKGWYSRPMWFASMIISCYLIFWVYIAFKHLNKMKWHRGDELSLIILTPCTVLFIPMSIFSGFGALTVLHCAIPSVTAIAIIIFYSKRLRSRSYLTKIIVFSLCLFPYYFTTAWSDWRFTYFDVVPEQMDTKITYGFGKGIKTNQLYADLYDWIALRAELFSEQNDFMISSVLTPMVHMIAKRRPALKCSFLCPIKSIIEKYKIWVENMEQEGRNPTISFIFENSPAVSNYDLKDDNRLMFQPWFVYPNNDPVTKYITQHMQFVDGVKYGKDLAVRFFFDLKKIPRNRIDKISAWIWESIQENPNKINYYYILEKLYQEKGFYKKYNMKVPLKKNSLQTLTRLTTFYIKEKRFNDAIFMLTGPIKQLQPDNAVIYYNISCLYAIQNRTDESVEWLKKAFNKGYCDWDHLKNDKDLINIKNTSYYKTLLKNID